MMFDIRYVTNMSKYHQNPLSPYVDDFSTVNNRYLFRYAIFGPIWAPKRGFGPKFRIG